MRAPLSLKLFPQPVLTGRKASVVACSVVTCCRSVFLKLSESTAFLLCLVSVPDKEDSGFYHKTSQGHNSGDITKLPVHCLIYLFPRLGVKPSASNTTNTFFLLLMAIPSCPHFTRTPMKVNAEDRKRSCGCNKTCLPKPGVHLLDSVQKKKAAVCKYCNAMLNEATGNMQY